jgi:hypothetical protein
MEEARGPDNLLKAATLGITQRVKHISRLASPTTRVLVQARPGTENRTTVTNLTFPTPNGSLSLVPIEGKQQFSLADSANDFLVNVGYAGDLAFQRAAVLAGKLSYWGREDSAIRLQWMFATRVRINLLKKAEELLEKPNPSSLQQAIKLLRCAQGLETN